MKTNINYHIAPSYSIENDLFDDCKYIIVSSENRYDSLAEKENVCVLHFADTEVETRLDAFCADDLEVIIGFLKDGEYENVFIACDEGQSRSPAIAAGLLKCTGNDDNYIWESDEYRPNVHVYKTILKYFNSTCKASVKKELKLITETSPEEYIIIRKNGL